MPPIRLAFRFSAFAAALVIAACNTTEPKDDAGGSGGGDFDVVAGMRYGDTAYTHNSTLFAPEGDRYLVQGGSFSHRRGDSTVTNWVSSVQVRIGAAEPASGTYEVIGNHADPRTPLSMLPGKASIYTYNILGRAEGADMSWSHPDSTVGARVKVVVTTDSVQVIGKNIKLSSGKLISFNFVTARPTSR